MTEDARLQALAPLKARSATWIASLKPLVPVALLAAIALVAFRPSMSALAALWGDPLRRTYEHGYLIAAIVAWLVYRDRRRLAALPARPSVLLLAAGLAGSLAWAVAVRAGIQTAHLVIWPVALWCSAGGILGWRAARILAFPLACLYLATPIWEPLLPWLQHATVAANRVLIGLAGIPAWVEGSNVHLSAGTFAIDERCSGLSYLVAGVSLAVLLGQFNREPARRRWLLVVLAAVLALVSNWLRVFTVIVAGHLTDMQHYFVQVDHISLGWVLFGIVFVGFFLLVRLLPAAATVDDEPAAPTAARGTTPAVLLVGMAAFAAGPVLVAATAQSATEGAVIRAVDVAGWDGPTAAFGGWHPVFNLADAELLAEYERGADRVSVYAATFIYQEQGRELSGYNNSVYGSREGRAPLPPRRVDVMADTVAISMTESEWVAASGGRALVWWTYQVGTRGFLSGLRAQAWYGIASLASSPVSSIVALRADCVPDCGAAREVLQRFGGAALPALLSAATQPEYPQQKVPSLEGTARQP